MRLSLCAVAIAAALLMGCQPASENTSNNAKQAASDITLSETSAKAASPYAADYYQAATQALFQARPLSASAYSLSEAQVGQAFAAEMEFFNSSRENALRQSMTENAQALRQLPLPELAAGAISQQVMTNILSFYAGDSRFPQGYIDIWMGHSPFIVNQINGPTIDMAGALLNSHPITNASDAQNYLARLREFGPALHSVADKFDTDAKSGWIPPRVLLDKSLKILSTYAQPDVKAHAVYQDFAKKLAAVSSIDATSQTELLEKAAQLVSTVVAPAYQQLHDKVKTALPGARAEAGIWAQPNGAEFYAYSVQQLGDTQLSPEQIHQIGLAEVVRISKAMDKILKANGYSEGSVGDRMAALNEEPRFLYEDSDAGRAALLADLNGYIKEMDGRVTELFKTRPPYPVEVRRIPVEVQDSAAGGQYTSPAIDGSKPGIYWINLADMKANAKFDLKTLTYHEATPGHHWQIALNLAQEQLPLLQRIAPYNAYAEGWALYAEQVAAEMGMYKNDPFGDLGRLKAELFRSVRLVVDTGIHAKKWSREQAIQYMAETTGTASSDVISEIERYMAWPGQALGYKLGMLKIIELREKARQALGDKFDIRAFHDMVLLGGAMPMQILEQQTEQWIQAQLQP